MKFNMPKDWCEKMARLEQGHSISAGTHELDRCPSCRGIAPDITYCDMCERTGVVLVERNIKSLNDEG